MRTEIKKDSGRAAFPPGHFEVGTGLEPVCEVLQTSA